MSDSKHSRGLALSAVSALAVTGLAFIPSQASAAPSSDVVMISQSSGKISVRPHAPDSAPTALVDLVAERLDESAGISFEVNQDPAAGDTTAGWTAIAGTPELTGDFANLSWDASAFVGSSISLRAVAITASRTSYSTVKGVAVTGAPTGDAVAPHSVSVSTYPGAYFRQPYADTGHTGTQLVVSGTSSAGQGSVGLSWWRSSDGTFRGSADAALTPGQGKISDGSTNPPVFTMGTFQDILDITGYDAAASGDVLAIRGMRDSDDVTPVALREQTIGGVTASNPSPAQSRRRQIEIRVRDTEDEGLGVAGAEVRRLSDKSLVGYTDAQGIVVATQDAATSETYYVNTTDTDAYQQDVDFTTAKVTTPEFTPVVSDVVPVLDDGTSFDSDEYEAGDIALQLVDQDGEPIRASGQQIGYALYGPHADGDDAPVQTVATPDAEGHLVIPAAAVSTKGDYFLGYSLRESGDGGWETNTVSLTSGDSTLTLTPDKTAGTVASGGQVTYTGKLDLDGTPLAGRSIDLAYTRGTETAPGSAADAGIVVGNSRVLTTTVTTDKNGEFTATVADPVEAGLPAESGGTLTATAPAAKETASATVTFSAGPVVPVTPPKAATVKLRLSGSSKGRAADKLTVSSARTAAGQRVRVYAKNGKGAWKVVKTVRLDRAGRVAAKIKDRNGTKVTSYRVQLIASASVKASTSNVKRLR